MGGLNFNRNLANEYKHSKRVGKLRFFFSLTIIKSFVEK